MQSTATRGRRGRLAWISAALTAGLATVVTGAAFAVPGVSPASVSATLAPGQSNVQAKSVETSPIPPRPDILFLADTTGSMGSAIANVQANATSIMNTVRTAQADSQFAAAEYRDFGCTDPFAYRLNQAITASIPAAQAGIDQWAAGDGCDTPEAQVNALFEAAQNATGWRSGSSRIIVWFGDASGHDPSGGHTLAQAIAALQANGIRVIAINVATGSAFSDGLDNTGQATAVTSATGGTFFASATPDQVSNAILSTLQNLPVTVTHSVACPTGVFANLTPASQTGTSGQTFGFSETYGVNVGTPAGVYVCTVDFLQNGLSGGPAFRETITITVNADLAIVKSGPALVTEGNNVVYTLAATNNGPAIATGVTVTDAVPVGTTFVSAGPGCTQAAGVVTCTAASLNPGQTVTFTFTVQAGSGSSIFNLATISGSGPDPNLANNRSTLTTRINHNPICTAATTGLGDLWPPNHKLVDGQIAGVTDPDGDPISLAVTGIQQDEPVNGVADGNTAPDATIGSGGSFAVRAERAGTGDGRVYAIAFRATDGLGGQCTATLLVGVPHDQGNGSTPVNSAPPWFDSTAS